MTDSDQSNHGESKRHRENIKDGGDSDRSDYEQTKRAVLLDKNDGVPIEVLEDLADELEDDGIKVHPSNPYPTKAASEKAASKVREVIDTYGDGDD